MAEGHGAGCSAGEETERRVQACTAFICLHWRSPLSGWQQLPQEFLGLYSDKTLVC